MVVIVDKDRIDRMNKAVDAIAAKNRARREAEAAKKRQQGKGKK